MIWVKNLISLAIGVVIGQAAAPLLGNGALSDIAVWILVLTFAFLCGFYSAKVIDLTMDRIRAIKEDRS